MGIELAEIWAVGPGGAVRGATFYTTESGSF